MLAFYTGTGPIGAAIRLQTWGKYSHVGYILPDGSIIEAWQKGGVRHNPTPFALHGPKTLIDVYTVRGLTPDKQARAERFMRRQIDAGYDFMGIVRFLSHVNRNNYDRWFCSELMAEAFQEAGHPLLNTEAWRISPVALSWSTELQPVFQQVGIDWWKKLYGPPAPATPEAGALDDLLP